MDDVGEPGHASGNAPRVAGAVAALFSFAAAGLVSAERQPTRESGISVWYAAGAPEASQLWRPGDPGERLFLRGRVLDVRGEPVAGALIELWHADRLVHNAYKLQLQGESMRKKRKKLTQTDQSKA